MAQASLAGTAATGDKKMIHAADARYRVMQAYRNARSEYCGEDGVLHARDLVMPLIYVELALTVWT